MLTGTIPDPALFNRKEATAVSITSRPLREKFISVTFPVSCSASRVELEERRARNECDEAEEKEEEVQGKCIKQYLQQFRCDRSLGCSTKRDETRRRESREIQETRFLRRHLVPVPRCSSCLATLDRFLVRFRADIWPGLVGSLFTCVHTEAVRVVSHPQGSRQGCCSSMEVSVAVFENCGGGGLREVAEDGTIAKEWTAGVGGWMETECPIGALLWLLLLPLAVCMSCRSVVVADALVSCLLRSLGCCSSVGSQQMLYAGCAFGEWADDAKVHGIENLKKFRKAGKYRLHLDKTAMTGTEVGSSIFCEP